MQNLHLSCFDQAIPNWVNTDITPHIKIAKIPGAARLLHMLGRMDDKRLQQHKDGVFSDIQFLDMTRPFPFEDGSFKNVFCAHVFEHLFHDDAVACAREVHRVLAPGGVFRVTVPDLDYAIERYNPEQPEELLHTVFEATQANDKNRHQWMYNAGSMARLLEKAGFERTARCDFQQGECADLDKLDNRPDGTLFMEGYR